MDQMSYEILLRRAHGLAGGQMLSRWGDPAGLADASYIASSDPTLFAKAKSSAIYSMAIFQKALEEQGKKEDYDKAELYIDKLSQAQNGRDALLVIHDFMMSIVIPNFN